MLPVLVDLRFPPPHDGIVRAAATTRGTLLNFTENGQQAAAAAPPTCAFIPVIWDIMMEIKRRWEGLPYSLPASPLLAWPRLVTTNSSGNRLSYPNRSLGTEAYLSVGDQRGSRAGLNASDMNAKRPNVGFPAPIRAFSGVPVLLAER